MDESRHIPVLADRVIHDIAPVPDGCYVDATLGWGGHTLALLRAGAGRVLALDRDATALHLAGERIREAGFEERVVLEHACYHQLRDILSARGMGPVQGVVLDAGVSSMQLDDPERGFSFLHQGPLDMRMDRTEGIDAACLIERAQEAELKRIIWEFGQEPMAGRIAARLVQERQKTRISTTRQLAEIVSRAYPPKRRAKSRNHPATKTFQALRIAVNHELESLREFVAAVPDVMAPKGRIAIITFHSLEDRIVKHGFRALANGCTCPPGQQVCTCDRSPRVRILTKKPITPEAGEMAANSRSRSAKLRVVEKI